MSGHIQVLTTAENKEDANKIAKTLVDNGLAACVQIIGPISSIYRWKGKTVEGEEWLCVIKTRSGLYDRVEKEILELHPYEVPEIIATSIVRGYERYLNWVDKETTGEKDNGRKEEG